MLLAKKAGSKPDGTIFSITRNGEVESQNFSMSQQLPTTSLSISSLHKRVRATRSAKEFRAGVFHKRTRPTSQSRALIHHHNYYNDTSW